eukprot:CAMPEP_0183742174 /NCGR_PEP_ID=MMETSP0737-20130205/64115_1 /TAXON_ID=385413 /ORGANISM="Thalassiosira miniscula, Strain CCMP1093" /LENGTH=193 /DNA_ID=CAMNT_0025977715 /DNA_START=39 /DNA_END=617 /DNA_ORIENTATION=+
MSSEYGGLDTNPADAQQGASGGGDVEGWLHVPTTQRSASRSKLAANDDEETQSLASSKIQALEMGEDDAQDNSDDDGSSDVDTDDEDDYELTDRAPTLKDHLSGRTTLFVWRPKEQLRCVALFLIAIGIASGVVYWEKSDAYSSSHKPPGAVGVGHAAYDALHSSWLEEYEARLTLYRHRATGAEYLAYVPDV